MSHDIIEAPGVELVTLAHPFSFERERVDVQAGLTIAELLQCAGIPRGTPVRVFVNGDLIYEAYYHVVRPKRGSHVLVRVVPRGGGGEGGQGKNIGTLILGVLLIVVGVVLAVGGVATFGVTAAWAPAVISMGIGLTLSAVINMLIPPPSAPKLRALAGLSNQEPESPTLSVSGATNAARPYGVVPRVFGTHKIYPPYAAAPYTETMGADQYLRLLFCIGLGITEIEDLRIGDTALSNYEGVETEIRTGAAGEPPITLYTTDVNEIPLSILLEANEPRVRTSSNNATELSIDIAFPEGLVLFGGSGQKISTTVSITVEYRLTGTSTWTAAPGSPLVTTDARQSPARNGLRWTVTSGQYDVQLTRTTANSIDPLLRNTSFWSALRSYSSSAPILLPGLALVAMRIKATDQLNGVVDQFNCIAHSHHLDWATYSGTVLSDAPLGYWRLGEILGSPTAFDISGHAHSGTYVGSPTLGATGLLTNDANTSMSCDGTDDTVQTFDGLTAIDMGGSSFTIEAIIRPSSIAAETRGILHKGDGLEFTTAHFGWSLRRSTAKLQFVRAFGSGSPTILESAANLVAGSTYHVVVTYNKASGVAVMTLNGTATATANLGTTTYSDTYGLEFCYPQTLRFAGVLDEVSIYPTLLSDARIARHYAAFQGTREWVVQRSSNPASHYREVLQGPGNARPVADDRLDLPEFEAWHEECSNNGRSCNLVVDYTTTVYELLKTIAATGRATPTMNDLKFATVRDIAQTVPRQFFTPRNSKNFRGRRVIPETLHGLKVKFIDPGSGWQQVERIVYDDGFNETNADKFEAIELHGCTDPDLAWRIGRYHIACARARRESYDFETDIENLACRRGDLIHVAHDVTEWGVAWGRVKSVAVTGGQATGVTLDEMMPMLGTGTYAMRFRLADLTSVVTNLATMPGESTAVTFQTPMAAPYPAPGDLALMGVVGSESVPCIVSMIRPGPDLSAVLTVVDAAPGVLTADQGNIPPFDPQMTQPIKINRNPPTPLIDSIISDETVLLRDLDGSLDSGIVITLHYQSTSNVQADFLEVRYRRSDATSPFETLPRLPPDTTQVLIKDVEDGVAYDIRLRTVNREGPTSTWTEIFGHVVIGKTSAPPAPVNARVESTVLVGDRVQARLAWDYPAPPLDLAGFEVRRSPGTVGNWMTALEMHVGLVAGPFDLGAIFGQWTVMVAAVDTSGNASAPAEVTADFGTPPLRNTLATVDYHATGFPGTITNGAVDGVSGDLEATQVLTGFWTQNGNRFWSPSGATLFWQGTYLELTYDFTYTTAANMAGTALVFYPITVVSIGWTLSYRVGASGDYVPFPGVLPNVLASQLYSFRLVTFAGVVQGTVTALTLIVDAPTIVEEHLNFATAATTGTRLTLINTFHAIKQVQLTVIGGDTAISAKAVDQNNVAGANNGPLIQCFGSGAAIVAGHVNALVTGY